MESRKLGQTSFHVSRIALGTMTFGKQVDEATASSMIDVCLDHGVNFIDTANVYNAGASESILGQILGGRREKVTLATKVGIRVGDQPSDVGLSKEAIQRQIEESLRRLRTDCVDLYYLHQPDATTALEETLDAMDRLVRAGKIRTVGASNYSAWQVCRMRWIADKNNQLPVSVAQPMYNLLARNIEPEFLPMCRTLGVATVVYNPLAGGLLTGKYRANQDPASGTRFDGNAVYRDRYWRPENFEAVRRLQRVAASEDRSLISVALNWLLHHSAIDCVILGASSLEQLKVNVAAAEEGPLSESLVSACQDVWPLVRPISPIYHRD
jgi:aryl-alcohol dehydrogenase-like predicted oxidoreductase